MALNAGTRLGPYEIVAPIGAGGMGEVYKARDTRLDRTVAIKVLPSHLSENAELRQRFEREARAVSSLSHSHICALYDVGRQDGVDFLVMEYLEGETVAARLEKGRLPFDELLRYGIEIADALDKAHRQGFVHRDLKPGNVMLTTSGAKLLDFGLAKSTGIASSLGDLTASPTVTGPLTADGVIVGTYQYMSPEQLEGNPADVRSDIFAFGVLLHEMATGKKAFEGKTKASVIAGILEREPPPVSSLHATSPPALDRLVQTCMAKNPDERRQTMRDVLLDLRWIAEAGSQAGAAMPERRRRWRRETLAWIAAAILLVSTGSLGVAYYRGLSRPVVRASIAPPATGAFHMVGFGAGPVSVSPDGTQLVFSADGPEGEPVLWIRPIDELVARPITGTKNASSPFWSPDSRIIGFFADEKLKKIDAAGGPPLTLCDSGPGRGGTWSADGVIVYGSRNGPLFRVSAAGGEPTQLTELAQSRGESTHRWPWFLPDGKLLLYFGRSATRVSEGNGVMIASLEGGESKVLLRNQSNAIYASGHLLFLRETTLMAQSFDVENLALTGDAFPIAEGVSFDTIFSRGVFSASDEGILVYQTGAAYSGSELQWHDRSGEHIGTLGDRGLYIHTRVSRDLKNVAVSMTDPSVGPPDLWIYEVERGIRTRFTFHPSRDIRPVFSPDGDRLVFASSRDGTLDLFEKSLTGSGDAELLLASEGRVVPTSWSSDGEFIIYRSQDPDTQDDIWTLPLSGDREPIELLRSEFDEEHGSISPDGRWLAYTSDESGQEEVYVTTFPQTGRKWQISSAGGNWPHWRSDGSEIIYRSPNDMLVAVEVGQIGDTFEVGASQDLFEIRTAQFGSVFDVSPDGTRFLVNTAVEAPESSPLTLVVNWTADLER